VRRRRNVYHRGTEAQRVKEEEEEEEEGKEEAV
jgi:hypothetical protein